MMTRFIQFFLAILMALTATAGSGQSGPLPSSSKPSRQRVVSLAAGQDEILMALTEKSTRHQVVGLSHLAGDQRFSNLSAQLVKGIAKVGDNAEAILTLKPHLVFAASFNRPGLVQQLKHSGLQVVEVEDVRTMRDILQNITLMGEALQAQAEARTLVQHLSERLVKVAKSQRSAPTASPRPVLGYEPTGYLLGKNTLFDDMIKLAGGRNLAATQGIDGWQKMSLELLVTMNPSYVVVPALPHEQATLKQQIQKQPGWKSLRAVQTERLIFLSPALMMATSQYAVDAVEVLAAGMKSIH